MKFYRCLALALALATAATPLRAAMSNIGGKRAKVENGMVHFGGLLRSIIPVTAAPLETPLRYAAGNNCTFELVWDRDGAPGLNGPMTINTAPVRNRIAISIRTGDVLSSLLISSNGSITNFNSVDPFTRERITTANPVAIAEKTKQQLRQMYPGATNENILLGFPMLPRLVDNDGSVGSKVAAIDSLSGEWAAYYFQGMVEYEHHSGALLDLIRVMDIKGKPTNVRIGFLVAEYRTMMPLIFVYENLDRMRARVGRCDR